MSVFFYSKCILLSNHSGQGHCIYNFLSYFYSFHHKMLPFCRRILIAILQLFQFFSIKQFIEMLMLLPKLRTHSGPLVNIISPGYWRQQYRHLNFVIYESLRVDPMRLVSEVSSVIPTSQVSPSGLWDLSKFSTFLMSSLWTPNQSFGSP